MSRAFYTIVNGAAGGGRCRARADKALASLREAGVELDVHFTEAPGHAVDLAADAYADGERSFLCVGGDGTSFEVVNGLFRNGTPEGVRLAILPLGTGNSFLRDFGITNETDALNAILHGKPHSTDVIRVEHGEGVLHFINTMGMGFVAKVGALTNEKYKALGAGGYVAAVLTTLVQLEYYVDGLTLDGSDRVDRRPTVFVSFSNSQYTGGAMQIAPDANLNDGKIDVIRVGKFSRAGLLTTFPKIFAGTHVQHPLVEQSQVERVDFVDRREQDILVDGELLRLSLHSMNVVPQAIQVLA